MRKLKKGVKRVNPVSWMNKLKTLATMGVLSLTCVIAMGTTLTVAQLGNVTEVPKVQRIEVVSALTPKMGNVAEVQEVATVEPTELTEQEVSVLTVKEPKAGISERVVLREREFVTTTRGSTSSRIGTEARRMSEREAVKEMEEVLLDNSKAQAILDKAEELRLIQFAREEKEKADLEYFKKMVELAKIDAETRKENAEASLAVLPVPNIKTSFKSYMDYRAITNKNSIQYKLQQNPNTTTNGEGFRMLNGEYMVAVGTYYAKSAGTRIRVTLSTGKKFNAIVGDIKADIHTDSLNQHKNGNVVEFIVDTGRLPDVARRGGDVSLAPLADLTGNVVSIEVLSVPVK